MDVKSTLEKQKKRRETEIAVRRSERNPFLKFKPRSRSEIETDFERLELLIEAIEAESAQLEKKIVCSLLSFAGTESKGLVVRWYNWALKCHEDEELTLWLQLLAESLGKIERKKLAGGRAVKHLRSLKNKIEPKLLALFPVDNAELNDQHQLSLQDLSNDKQGETEERKMCAERNQTLMSQGVKPGERLTILRAEFPNLNLDASKLQTIYRTHRNRQNNAKAKKS